MACGAVGALGRPTWAFWPVHGTRAEPRRLAAHGEAAAKHGTCSGEIHTMRRPEYRWVLAIAAVIVLALVIYGLRSGRPGSPAPSAQEGRSPQAPTTTA